MTIELLRSRNALVAESVRNQDLSLTPRLRTVVLTCADHRVDPAHVLGLHLGDAVVLRNPGGRVSPDVVQSLLVLATVAGIEGIAADFDIIVMHHTDCGLSRLGTPRYRETLAAFAGIEPALVEDLHVEDPVLAVQYDVARLRALGLLSARTQVVGIVLDLATGLIQQPSG